MSIERAFAIQSARAEEQLKQAASHIMQIQEAIAFRQHQDTKRKMLLENISKLKQQQASTLSIQQHLPGFRENYKSVIQILEIANNTLKLNGIAVPDMDALVEALSRATTLAIQLYPPDTSLDELSLTVEATQQEHDRVIDVVAKIKDETLVLQKHFNNAMINLSRKIDRIEEFLSAPRIFD
eukprot:jgi/Hompol1/53/HPOL_005217-RA